MSENQNVDDCGETTLEKPSDPELSSCEEASDESDDDLIGSSGSEIDDGVVKKLIYREHYKIEKIGMF